MLEAPRAIAEGIFLTQKGVPLIAVDADRRVRYERIAKRGGVKDNVTFEEFSAQEDREMAQTEAHDMNIAGVIKMATHTLRNDGTVETLRSQVDKVLEELRKQED